MFSPILWSDQFTKCVHMQWGCVVDCILQSVLHTVFSLIMLYLSSFTSGLPVRITCVSFLCLIALVGASSTASNKMQFSLFPIWGKGGGKSFTVKLLGVRFYWFLFDKLKKWVEEVSSVLFADY